MAPHFTPDEREQLSMWLREGLPKAEIARRLQRHPTTIFREIKRNRVPHRYNGTKVYCAASAQQQVDCRRHQRRIRKMQRSELREYVQQHLQRAWSPDQIAGRLRREHPHDRRRWISPQAIYSWIRQDDHGHRWRQCLRRHRTRKRPKNPLSNKAAITGRPEIIERRERIGDWEGDTIVGPARRGALLNLVERKTGYALLAKLPGLQSATTNRSICRRLRTVPASQRLSITFDHGSEFSDHARLAKRLALAVYFAQPHCPWQRGTNEHTNGLVRQFLPKGTRLQDISPARVARIQSELNDRPRKRLAYQTPREAFLQPASGAMLS